MKYVILHFEDLDVYKVIVFDNAIVHQIMYDQIVKEHWPTMKVKPYSAGECYFDGRILIAHGRSATLGVDTKHDASLILTRQLLYGMMI